MGGRAEWQGGVHTSQALLPALPHELHVARQHIRAHGRADVLPVRQADSGRHVPEHWTVGVDMNAKERFKQTRQAVKRLDEVHALIMYECDDWKPPQVKTKTDKSDPTANKAIYNVDELGEKLEALRKEEAELTDFIGVSLAIIQAVRDGFGEIYANLLEWRYIDGLSFGQIWHDYEVKKATAFDRIEMAFDWIDSVGVSRLLKGDVEV